MPPLISRFTVFGNRHPITRADIEALATQVVLTQQPDCVDEESFFLYKFLCILHISGLIVNLPVLHSDHR